MSSLLIAAKLLLFTIILCYITVRLPFMGSIQRIADLSRNSLNLFSESEMSDDESADAMRKHAGQILAESLKLGAYLFVVALAAVVIWFLLNPGGPFSSEAFRVFVTLEGLAYPVVGMVVFLIGRKLLRRG